MHIAQHDTHRIGAIPTRQEALRPLLRIEKEVIAQQALVRQRQIQLVQAHRPDHLLSGKGIDHLWPTRRTSQRS